ncbi:MAG: hypothetical protein ACRDC7_00575 [Aeromonas veronii]
MADVHPLTPQITPATDEELYTVLAMAYPEVSRPHGQLKGEIDWDRVVAFADGRFASVDALKDLLGRLVALTMPRLSCGDEYYQAIGEIDFLPGGAVSIHMGIRRDIKTPVRLYDDKGAL